MAFVKWRPGQHSVEIGRLAEMLVGNRWAPRYAAMYVAEGIFMRLKFHRYEHPEAPIEALSAGVFAQVTAWPHLRNIDKFHSECLRVLRADDKMLRADDTMLRADDKLLQDDYLINGGLPPKNITSEFECRILEKRREEQTYPPKPPKGGLEHFASLRSEWDRQRTLHRLDPSPRNSRTVAKALGRLSEASGDVETAHRAIGFFFALEDRWVASRGYDGKAFLDRLDQVIGRAQRPIIKPIEVRPQPVNEPAADPAAVNQIINRLKGRRAAGQGAAASQVVSSPQPSSPDALRPALGMENRNG
jgi:hypothetical protein